MSEEVKEQGKPEPEEGIDKLGLYRAADLAQQAHYILQDVLEEYFEKYDSDNPADVSRIVYSFRRNRFKSRTVFEILCLLIEEFKELGITV